MNETQQMKQVHRLDPRVVEGIRSSFSIASQQQAIEELVLNSALLPCSFFALLVEIDYKIYS